MPALCQSKSRSTVEASHVFYLFFWLDADKLLIDIKINFPIKKVDANIQSSNKLPKGKQPMKGEHHVCCAIEKGTQKISSKNELRLTTLCLGKLDCFLHPEYP